MHTRIIILQIPNVAVLASNLGSSRRIHPQQPPNMSRHHMLNIILLILNASMPHQNLLDAFFLEPCDVLHVRGAVDVEAVRRVAVAVLVAGDDGCAAEGKGVHPESEVERLVADEAAGRGPVTAAGADRRDGGFGDGVGEEGVVGDGSGGEHFLFIFLLLLRFFLCWI